MFSSFSAFLPVLVKQIFLTHFPSPPGNLGHVPGAFSLPLFRNLRGHGGQVCSIQINPPRPLAWYRLAAPLLWEGPAVTST